ncbi:MAG: hypothetical protein AAGB04_23125 [Pseudomonadota bacterium]
MWTFDNLIDNAGAIHDRQSGVLRLRYGADVGSKSFSDYSIRNLGFIAVRGRPGSCQIRAAPGRVGHLAFSSLTNLVSSHEPDMAALEWYGRAWHEELHRGPKAVLERFVGLMLTTHVQTTSPFSSHPAKCTELEKNSALSGLLNFWKDKGGKLSLRRHRHELEEISKAKFLIVRRGQDSPHIVAEHYGKGLDLYPTKGWRQRLTGRRLDEQPDMAFGRWVSDSYRDVMIVNEPVLSRVDVTTYDPAARLKVRKQYTRLALPIDKTAVLSGSIVHNSAIVDAEFGYEPK